MPQDPTNRPPDLIAGPLRLWVHNQPYPSSRDSEDADWLNVTAECGAHGALVRASGVLLMSSDLKQWSMGLLEMHKTLKGEAVLDPYEPNLKVTIRSRDRTGHMTLRVEITADHMEQGHWSQQTIDQSYLPAIAASIGQILDRFPAPQRSAT